MCMDIILFNRFTCPRCDDAVKRNEVSYPICMNMIVSMPLIISITLKANMHDIKF